jgi:hypothetical protein
VLRKVHGRRIRAPLAKRARAPTAAIFRVLFEPRPISRPPRVVQPRKVTPKKSLAALVTE